MFDWSDVQGWNHEVLAYVDEDNKSVLELVLYDLNVPANGKLVIDPVYGFIAVAHYIEALQPFGLTLSGTINTYIGIQNWLKLLNTTSAPIEVSISYQNANTETLTIPSYGRTDRLISNNDSNSYGACTLTTLHAGSLSASITRIRPLNGVSDFTAGHVVR